VRQVVVQSENERVGVVRRRNNLLVEELLEQRQLPTLELDGLVVSVRDKKRPRSAVSKVDRVNGKLSHVGSPSFLFP
jgi:hypothetical protein